MTIRYLRGDINSTNIANLINSLNNDTSNDIVYSSSSRGYTLEKSIPQATDVFGKSFLESAEENVSDGDDALLSSEVRLDIYRSHANGVSLRRLATRYACSTSTIRQIVLRGQYEEIMSFPLDFIGSSEFTCNMTRRQEDAILREAPGSENVPQENHGEVFPTGTADIPAYLSRLNGTTLLTTEQEHHLFRKMNYLKYKASRLRDSLDPTALKASVMTRIEWLYREMIVVKNILIASNLRLVVSIAKKHATLACPLYDLISDGNISLIRAVDKFDYSRGNKFSTYASWAIYRNYARSIPTEKKHQHRFHSGNAEMFDMQADDRTDRFQTERVSSERLSQVIRFMDRLDERERDIIERRYGLGRIDRPQTLRQVGKEMGVTKERIRQIETRALAKLRKVAKEECMEMPEPY